MSPSLCYTAWLLVILLPVASSFNGRIAGKPWIARYLIWIGAYTVGAILVGLGYVFQNGVVQGVPWMRIFDTGWTGLIAFQEAMYSSGLLPIVIIASSIITFSASFAATKTSRAIIAFRTAFLTYVTFDIMEGIVGGYELEGYVINVVSDSIGSFLFACVFALIVDRFIPLGQT